MGQKKDRSEPYGERRDPDRGAGALEIAWFIGIIMAFASDTKLRIATRKEDGIRALVKEMNRCIDAMDLKGLQQLIRQHIIQTTPMR